MKKRKPEIGEKLFSQVAHEIHQITYGIFLFSILTEVMNI